jgi:hypothetical protein
MTRKSRRGRPCTFLPADRKYLAELVRQYGIAGARRQTGVPISGDTLGQIARGFRIVLRKGRRPKAAA